MNIKKAYYLQQKNVQKSLLSEVRNELILHKLNVAFDKKICLKSKKEKDYVPGSLFPLSVQKRTNVYYFTIIYVQKVVFSDDESYRKLILEKTFVHYFKKRYIIDKHISQVLETFPKDKQFQACLFSLLLTSQNLGSPV